MEIEGWGGFPTQKATAEATLCAVSNAVGKSWCTVVEIAESELVVNGIQLPRVDGVPESSPSSPLHMSPFRDDVQGESPIAVTARKLQIIACHKEHEASVVVYSLGDFPCRAQVRMVNCSI
jgi:hypothetical protein